MIDQKKYHTCEGTIEVCCKVISIDVLHIEEVVVDRGEEVVVLVLVVSGTQWVDSRSRVLIFIIFLFLLLLLANLIFSVLLVPRVGTAE